MGLPVDPVKKTAVTASKKLTFKEKVSYGFGDIGNGLMFDMGQLYLLKFYTDVLGISAYWGGLVFLISKIFDAFADTSVGAFVDSRTNISKRGKFRPFILWGTVPLALMTVISFLAPDFSDNGKIVWAFITYMGFGLAYSIVNIPYGSLSAAMTQDPIDRASLGSFRAIGSQMALLISGMAVIPIVVQFANKEVGYIVAISVMVIFGILFHLICYHNTTENVIRAPKNEKVPLSTLFKALVSNRPLIVLCLAALFMITSSNIRNAVQLYYLEYNLKNPELMSILSFLSIGLAVVGSMFIPTMVKRIGKKNTFMLGLMVCIASDVLNFVLPTSTATFLTIFSLGNFGLSFALGLPWVMIADSIDYHEWNSGERTEGIVYSTYSFFRKLAQALAGFIPGVALGLIGYVPNIQQSADTLLGLKGLLFLAPAALNIIGLIILFFFYNLTDNLYSKIVADLKERNKDNQLDLN
ncbi:glycoside-pentoside-hexuronide (GPH):cation symporter [Peribacillus simplex]|uniref:MFS transporter n=1 Tax=Peribacillus simplex NBRC 15720 = DSM 1321 TaxID=1349754 RepID=A0A223ECX5_9BACI|nr:glycoside-pentoside-hexuronide (GPH):cation symporter [Peribacillus simplex]ASS93051.1 MFS transporter [Peribacillus simplex NBRC 15720 = DSM 1321]MEC1400254.1 glycoside-pentoside-hexuronide (GPH):cation symporter [Peribacillus simplex]